MNRVMLALLALTLCVVCAHAQWPEENHYKVYNIDPPQLYPGPIQLTDQFGGYNVDLLTFEKFANPVEKNNEPILFPDVHQTWWAVDLTGSGWIIEIENQFGPQVWRVANPKYLVLPARKNIDGPLLQHNHYLAYEAFGDIVDVPVHLIDQWGLFDGIAVEPVFFLNPVEKVTPDGGIYPIIDPTTHLACYRIEPPFVYDMQAVAFDQFGEWGFLALDHDCLCVPSYKYEVVPTEQRSWSDIKRLYHD